MIQDWEVGQPVEDAFCIAVLMVDMDAGHIEEGHWSNILLPASM